MSPGGAGPDKLPSEEVYAEFNERNDCTGHHTRPECNQRAVKKMQGALGVGGIVNDELANKIVSNYYYACTQKRSGLPGYYKPCHFLYFWICTQVKEKMYPGADFRDTMNSIYDRLWEYPFGKSGYIRKCGNIYRNITKDFCELVKKFSDYEYNIKALQSKPECKNDLLQKKYDTKNLTEIQKTYSDLCNHCRTPRNTYCKEFTKNHWDKSTWKPWDSLKLTCTTAREEECEDPSSGLGVSKQDCKLDDLLTSKEHYRKFEEAVANCNGSSLWPPKVDEKSEGSRDIEKYAQQAAEVVCCVHEKVEEGGRNGEYCNFLYFWVGDKILETVRDNEFPEVMKRIYQNVGTSSTNFTCTNIYDGMDDTNFNRVKRVYEYQQDYETIKGKLQSDISCKDDVDGHLDDICGAYTNMVLECTRDKGKGKKYCDDLREIFSDDKYKELLGEDCTINVPSQVEAASAAYGAITSPSGSNITPAVSGTLATIGMAAAASFFLYKYDLLPSGIKKFLGWNNNNNKRKSNSRRRRFAEHNFRTIKDDSSLGSITTNDSTTDTSTMDDSTLYSAPYTTHSRRTRNVQKKKNIGYQSMEH